eukprot:CAMPEP_0177433972 /NCGR_PEP_ID=MMETSP0369-20130122/133_1 /TAXON_ID=447022 ORGANISM="Scrippsiella hangoei-like, Strain SHHI-4" /NCGR_SAMPLE_ID=MMETSP0369 /ASSEMBLY_ACC=CAM_ASM_000364 /LENGTH=138 /DNA_ID=CAMNT_0018904761 /DNA_START=513 /DNA_END=928 /DNA_ORIENTATION=-
MPFTSVGPYTPEDSIIFNDFSAKSSLRVNADPNHWAELSASIIELALRIRWVDASPVRAKQHLICAAFGIVRDPHSSRTIAHSPNFYGGYAFVADVFECGLQEARVTTREDSHSSAWGHLLLVVGFRGRWTAAAHKKT